MAQQKKCVKTKRVNSPATGHKVERCAKYAPVRSPKKSPKKSPAKARRSPAKRTSPTKRASPLRSPARKANKWNKFLKANAGRGHSPSELSAMYAKQH